MVGLWRLWCLQLSVTCSASISLGISLTAMQANRPPPANKHLQEEKSAQPGKAFGLGWDRGITADLSFPLLKRGSDYRIITRVKYPFFDFCRCHSYPILPSSVLLSMLFQSNTVLCSNITVQDGTLRFESCSFILVTYILWLVTVTTHTKSEELVEQVIFLFVDHLLEPLSHLHCQSTAVRDSTWIPHSARCLGLITSGPYYLYTCIFLKHPLSTRNK